MSKGSDRYYSSLWLYLQIFYEIIYIWTSKPWERCDGYCQRNCTCTNYSIFYKAYFRYFDELVNILDIVYTIDKVHKSNIFSDFTCNKICFLKCPFCFSYTIFSISYLEKKIHVFKKPICLIHQFSLLRNCFFSLLNLLSLFCNVGSLWFLLIMIYDSTVVVIILF